MGKQKLMDQMDIDCVLVVPDTPTRLPAKNAEYSSGVHKEIDASLPSLSGQGNVSTEQQKTQLNNATGIRRLFIHPPRRHASNNSECHANSSTSGTRHPSSSSRIDNLFARKDTSFSNSEGKDSGCLQLIKKDSTDSNPGYSCKDSLHLMEKSMPAQVLSGSSQGEGFSKREVSSNGFSNLQSMRSSSETIKVDKEQFDDGYKAGFNMINGVRKEFVHDTQHNDNKDVCASVITLPRVTRQKRLVRNGCISPHNIAKAKKPVGRDHNDLLTVKQNYCSSVSSSSNSESQINVKDLVSEGHASNTMKGKGIMAHPFTSTGLNGKNGHTSFRNVIDVDEEVSEIAAANQDAFRSIEESGGWRSTRNCYQISLSDEDPHLSLGNDINACSETKHNQHKLLRRENGTNAQSHDHYPNCEDLSSHRYPSARNSSQVARPLGQQLSHIDVHHPVIITPLGKRQKQGSTSINNAECSTSAFNDADIIFRDSYRDPNNNSRENTNQNCSRRDNLEPIIDIDDLSPQATNDGSKGVACCRSDEDARARQVEADEALALELQEQLFNETPVFGVDNEVDQHVARALQQEDFHLSFSGDTHHRSRSFANTRHSQYQSSVNASRGAPRASNSNRLARWRSRFPGQPRTLLPSTGRNSIFPSYMDVETRMEVLETLEAFSNMGVHGDFLQTQRDFNENDYEMLLALDENNHQHAGASMHQINGLPESTVQNENLEEACSICLENPTMGDTIRHLPCLHKFHKDCIDPWLQRRSSCPVCKSSIA
ncbi:PREDICTED: uncharacterized protein LOC109161945 isoform X1 [Ipomoea nil]|uniref:uncharacterized protein LOC109161945 isoform X1 n=2 Tax=Ipomoea nil TaxID=35883 RepID=UPI00090168E4|nr:PREDICTED: uncharacterized protein LOC109161945 isoform X1 [Ipomoea nil]